MIDNQELFQSTLVPDLKIHPELLSQIIMIMIDSIVGVEQLLLNYFPVIQLQA